MTIILKKLNNLLGYFNLTYYCEFVKVIHVQGDEIMIDKSTYLKIKSDIQSAASNNSQQLLGFLQKFYAVNVVREIGSLDDELKNDVNALAKDALEELYSSEACQRHINGLVNISEDKLRTSVTTIALIEGFFPEFLDGRFNPNTVSTDTRELATMIVNSTNAYQRRTPEFKSALSQAMARPIDRSNYVSVSLSPELEELLYEDHAYSLR